MSKKLAIILVCAVVLMLVVAAIAWSLKQELRLRAELKRTEETAPHLAELHRQASQGKLRLLGPETLEMAFIDAGFPPKRPMPSLTPRAQLKGGALADAGRQTVALTHYLAGEGHLTVFTLPSKDAILPSDSTMVMRRGTPIQMVKRGDVALAFWTTGSWITCVATEMPEGDRNLFIDLVRATQGD